MFISFVFNCFFYRSIEDMLQYGGTPVDEALGHNEAFFTRQQQQHDHYGTPIIYKRTPVFSVKRLEQSDAQKRTIMGELERLRRQRAQEQFNAKAAAAPNIPQLEDLLHNAQSKTENTSQTLKQEVPELPRKTRRDFFGRIVPIETPSVPSGDTKQKQPLNVHPSLQNVRYKFQEGFTNAVKRKLTLSFFL